MGDSIEKLQLLFKTIGDRFDAYARSFYGCNPKLDDAVTLKYEHTKRVCNETELLCDSIRLEGRLRGLALIGALLHDIARFEQFMRYGTFSDAKSINHAEAAVRIISELRILDGLDETESSKVVCAIRNHNAVRIPSGLDDEQTLLCRLLRDADKLDIYKIALDYYINPDPRRTETVQVGIPDGSAVSPDICERVARRETILYEQIRNVADFKMVQLGWVFDLNFKHSLRCVKERRYIENLKRQIPSTEPVLRAFEAVERYIDERIAG